MARSLQVQPEEQITTSPLLLGFLALAALLLTIGMVASAWSADDPSPSVEARPGVAEPPTGA